AGLGNAVRQERAIVAEGLAGQRHRAVLGPRIRIEQQLRLGVELVQRVEDGLVLQAGVLAEDVTRTMPGRRRDLLEVPQVGDALLDRLTLGDALEVAEG